MEHALDVDKPLNPNRLADPRPGARGGTLGGLVLLLRPRQWVKSGLVLLAPLLTAPATVLSHAGPLAITLLAFIIAASSVYVFNDLRDRERDRLHPVKRLRPLASGRVSAPAAITLLAGAGAVLVAFMLVLPVSVDLVLGAYLALNLWYCLALKHQSLVDVCVVAVGFVLRTMAGALAVGAQLRPSLLICVYCACLALSLGKRRHELARLADDGDALRHRPALTAYSTAFLDQIIVLTLVATLASYVSFVWLDVRHGALTAALTFPFATFAICRYLQMLTVQRSGGDPVEDLTRDRVLLVNGVLWLAALIVGVSL